jgi:PAS domain S-box-containing protein
MPWFEALSEPNELRGCIRDLIALSTLPALWQRYDPNQIAESVAAALLSMLQANFVYAALPGRPGKPLIEVVQTDKSVSPHSTEALRAAVRAKLPTPTSHQSLAIANPAGRGMLRLACAPIGFGGDAVVVVGSRDAGFPSEAHRLLLSIAANEATVAWQRWQVEADQHCFVTLIERSSDFVGLAELDGRPRYINPAGLALVGLKDMEQASGLHILDFLVPADRARVRDQTWPVVMRDGRWTGELGIGHFETGVEIPLLVDWFRVDDPRTGHPINTAAVCRDLSAQKQTEAQLLHLAETLDRRVARRTAQLEEANQRLLAEMAGRERADGRVQQLQLEFFHAARLNAAGQLAAALAHELNQPLTAATNSFNAARRLVGRSGHQLNGKVAEVMGEAAEQTLRAGQIVRRLRDFVTRGETEKRVESVASLIEEASALSLTDARSRGVEVRFHLDPSAAAAYIDRIQIQQVLINLMRNAVEAMADSYRRELEVTTRRLDDDMIEIAVADSGPGLSKNVEDRLFQPFVSTKRNGMGLGLSICRSIVEAHGGKIRSSPGLRGGTTFRFTVAAAPAGGDSHAG